MDQKHIKLKYENRITNKRIPIYHIEELFYKHITGICINVIEINLLWTKINMPYNNKQAF